MEALWKTHAEPLGGFDQPPEEKVAMSEFPCRVGPDPESIG